jgi:hypothetical protein
MAGSWPGHGLIMAGPAARATVRVVQVNLLVPLVVQVDGSVVAVRGAKERAMLSFLALRAGSVVSTKTGPDQGSGHAYGPFGALRLGPTADIQVRHSERRVRRPDC